jgi:putative aminopeptidase FrvX
MAKDRAAPIDLDLLERLSLAPGPSGSEGPVAAILRAALKPYAAEIRVDRPGNLIARIPGTKKGARSSAIIAHMDEVGLMVRMVEPNGFIRVARIGGIGRRSLSARPVQFITEKGLVPGVIGVKAHHLTDPAESQLLPMVDHIYVDVGVGSVEEVRALGIQVGTKAVYDAQFRRLANGRVSGKAIDDRALCCAQVEIARRLHAAPPPGDVWLIGSVREEFDLSGAVAATMAVKPDFALVLDITPAADTPDLAGVNSVRLGAGPAVKSYDFHGRGPLAGYIAPPGLVERIEAEARAAKIATQREVVIGVVTDAVEVGRAPEAPVVGCLALPMRYSHSPVELAALDDLAALIELATRVVTALPADAKVFQPPW